MKKIKILSTMVFVLMAFAPQSQAQSSYCLFLHELCKAGDMDACMDKRELCPPTPQIIQKPLNDEKSILIRKEM